MKPDELTLAAFTCGWTPQQVAAMCGYHRNTGTAWTKGLYAVPDDVAKWLRKMASFAAKNPPPKRDK